MGAALTHSPCGFMGLGPGSMSSLNSTEPEDDGMSHTIPPLIVHPPRLNCVCVCVVGWGVQRPDVPSA